MLRRHFIASVLASVQAAKSLDRLFEGAHGAAVLVDRKSRRPIAAHASGLVAAALGPAGSTLKPLILDALIERGVVHTGDRFPCTGDLRVAGRSFACSHPHVTTPLSVREAIAYSCNSFVARCASQTAPGEVTDILRRCGLDSRTHWFGEAEAAGRVWGAPAVLQALGEEGVLVTVAGLAMAYVRLADRAQGEVRGGMEDAVEFGTAQRAQVAGLKIAGKTGTARTKDGATLAWFAGFTDAAVVTVMLQGRSGGADAAPIGGRILEAHWRGTL